MILSETYSMLLLIFYISNIKINFHILQSSKIHLPILCDQNKHLTSRMLISRKILTTPSKNQVLGSYIKQNFHQSFSLFEKASSTGDHNGSENICLNFPRYEIR